MNNSDFITLWKHINDNGDYWFKILKKKYPEYQIEFWIQKYIDRNLAACVPELMLIATKETFGINCYWCNNANINNLEKITISKMLPTITLKTIDKKPHCYICKNYSAKKKQFTLEDAMHNGFRFHYYESEIIQQIKGNPVFISGLLKDKADKEIILKILESRNLYII